MIMNKFSTVLMSGLLLSAATASAKSFEIKGLFHGDTEGKTVYLMKSGTSEMSKYRPQVLDSTVIKDGKFLFKGKLDEPTLLLVKYFPNDNRGDMEPDGRRAAMRPVLPLYIDGGKISVEASVDSMENDFMYAIYGTYDYKDAKITGSALNDLYREYLQGHTDAYAKVSDANEAYSKYYYYTKEGVKIDKVSELLDKADAAKAEEQAWLKGFITRNADNLVGLLALNETLGRFDKAGIESLKAVISDKMKATPLGRETMLKADTIANTANGAQFVDVSLQDPDGKDHRLSEYLGKGHYTLLEFWASWCGPCRASIPHLKQVYGLYHPQSFDIVSVSMDTDNKAWHKALGEEQMVWPQLICGDGFGEVAKLYNFNGIPYCVLIGPKGEVVETNCRDGRLDRQLVRLYGNKLESLHLTAQLKEWTDTASVMTVDFGSTTPAIKKYALKDGKLDLTLPLDKPTQMALMIPGDYMKNISLPAVPGEELTVDGSFYDYTIGGSNFYQEYKPVAEMEKEPTVRMEKGREAFEALYSQLKDSKKKKDKQTLEEAKAKYVQEYEADLALLKAKAVEYIKANPKKEASVVLLQLAEPDSIDAYAEKFHYTLQRGRFATVIEALKKQAENEQARKRAKEAVKEGVEAPDFTLNDLNGQPLTLSKMRGQWIILDFWGSWCSWCIKGLPDMKAYYQKYAGKFEIIGIDCRDTDEKWRAAVEKHQIPWLHVYNAAADGTPEKYAVEGYPTKIIIDPDGKINKVIVGEDPEFYTYLDTLFQ